MQMLNGNWQLLHYNLTYPTNVLVNMFPLLLPACYDVNPGSSDQEAQTVSGVRQRFIQHLQVSDGVGDGELDSGCGLQCV